MNINTTHDNLYQRIIRIFFSISLIYSGIMLIKIEDMFVICIISIVLGSCLLFLDIIDSIMIYRKNKREFLTFLKHKCSERNVKLYIVNESFTTQACCNCGCLNTPNDREYICKECNIEIHRDINGSVNIGLKHVEYK